MTTLQLTDDQAKLLLILTGMCSGPVGSLGLYHELKRIVNADDVTGNIPSPIAKDFKHQTVDLYRLVIDREMLNNIMVLND